MELCVRLPLPAKELRPNARVHFMARARAKKKARTLACDFTYRALNAAGLLNFTPTSYRIIWYYWGMISDVDNCLAACKAYLDGCSDALHVNDRQFRVTGIERVHCRDKRVEIIFSDL